ncbi:hypothetical protein D3C86_1728640 [compost metagenome]
MLFKRRFAHPNHLGFGFVAVGYKAAFEPRGATRDIRNHFCHPSARTGFRRRQRSATLLQRQPYHFAQLPQFMVSHHRFRLLKNMQHNVALSREIGR